MACDAICQTRIDRLVQKQPPRGGNQSVFLRNEKKECGHMDAEEVETVRMLCSLMMSTGRPTQADDPEDCASVL